MIDLGNFYSVINFLNSVADCEFLFIKKSESPTPGIEPGPPGWKPGILAIRPCGMMKNKSESWKFIN